MSLDTEIRINTHTHTPIISNTPQCLPHGAIELVSKKWLYMPISIIAQFLTHLHVIQTYRQYIATVLRLML